MTTARPPSRSCVRGKFAARAELAAALVAREHALLVGPPGTAKSLLDGVARFAEGRRFTCLLTKFTLPEELFGPVSLAGLREDRYVRVTAGKLPEADVAFAPDGPRRPPRRSSGC